MKNKRNLNTEWLLLQNDQNADTTLLHSPDELQCLTWLKVQVFYEWALLWKNYVQFPYLVDSVNIVWSWWKSD